MVMVVCNVACLCFIWVDLRSVSGNVKMDFRKILLGVELTGSGCGPLVSFCVHSNEHSCTMNARNFLACLVTVRVKCHDIYFFIDYTQFL